MTSIFDIVSSSYLPIDTIYQEVEKRIASGTFISYAQNREDVYINRLFSDLSRGTYIDVGCFDPVLKSTTCALYRRGWRGINIDVSAQNIQKFIHERPADINSAIGSKNTSKDIYLYEGSTRSTFNSELGDDYIARGLPIQKKRVEVKTLTNILDSYLRTPSIDLLSVDVEGFEGEVFRGLDFSKYTPKLIVVEATYPETPRVVSDQWSDQLYDNGYKQVFFDGLNAYFYHKPTDQVRSCFHYPANYFDDFITYEYLSLLASALNHK